MVKCCIVHNHRVENQLRCVIGVDLLRVSLRELNMGCHVEPIILWLVEHKFDAMAKKDVVFYTIRPSWCHLSLGEFIIRPGYTLSLGDE
jgi:hypothetical protein